MEGCQSHLMLDKHGTYPSVDTHDIVCVCACVSAHKCVGWGELRESIDGSTVTPSRCSNLAQTSYLLGLFAGSGSNPGYVFWAP